MNASKKERNQRLIICRHPITRFRFYKVDICDREKIEEIFEEEKPEIAAFRRMNGVIRCLSDTEKRYELAGDDEAFALALLKKDGVIGRTQVYQEGDRIRIAEGAFEGLESRILKVDRRHTRMQIEIPFNRQMIKTWVEYEIVEPIRKTEEIL